jgi:hypothetical protein
VSVIEPCNCEVCQALGVTAWQQQSAQIQAQQNQAWANQLRQDAVTQRNNCLALIPLEDDRWDREDD